jgi:hypothetical protein
MAETLYVIQRSGRVCPITAVTGVTLQTPESKVYPGDYYVMEWVEQDGYSTSLATTSQVGPGAGDKPEKVDESWKCTNYVFAREGGLNLSVPWVCVEGIATGYPDIPVETPAESGETLYVILKSGRVCPITGVEAVTLETPGDAVYPGDFNIMEWVEQQGYSTSLAITNQVGPGGSPTAVDESWQCTNYVFDRGALAEISIPWACVEGFATEYPDAPVEEES